MWWPEIGVAVGLAGASWWATGRIRSAWPWVFAGAFLVTLVVMAARRIPGATAMWPLRWIADARVNPLVMALVVPAMLGVLVRRMPAGGQRGQRRAVLAVLWVMVGYYCVLPGVMPVVARGLVAGRPTEIDANGVCLQSHDFTCGPASMVTCLRVLGVRAEEGEVATLSRCGPGVGTDPDVLAEAVSRHFGVRARALVLSRMAELHVPAVMEIGSGMGWGHYVAVVRRRGDQLLIGDPELGMFWSPVSAMEEQWTGRVVEVGTR